MTETTNTTTATQNPQIYRQAIESAVIELVFAETTLADFLSFHMDNPLLDAYRKVLRNLRTVYSQTIVLEEIDPEQEIVRQVAQHLIPPTDDRVWFDYNKRPAEAIARKILELSERYRIYLGQKGVISISR